MDPTNALLFIGEAVLYFTIMAVLFRMRHRFGMGIFLTALGAMHFLETYLAAALYVEVPFGMASPGSAILFTGKLLVLLLVYIREDAATVRQPIYGLLFSNLLIVGLVALIRLHHVAAGPGNWPNLGFMTDVGGLMVWGSLLLVADSILIILLYERLGRWLAGQRTLRIALSAVAVLTFDQFGFYLGLRYYVGLPISALLGGWLAKLVMACVYSVMVSLYLRIFEVRAADRRAGKRLTDIFDTLTYRERYEALLRQAGRDDLTGLLDRGEFDVQGRQLAERAVADGYSMSLLVIDVDHFKAFNDAFGHAIGDVVLRHIAHQIGSVTRDTDTVFRYGGEEFAVLSRGLTHEAAVGLAQRICNDIAAAELPGLSRTVTVSIGVASAPLDGRRLDDLFAVADERLYLAKSRGRDCVAGYDAPEPPVRSFPELIVTRPAARLRTA